MPNENHSDISDGEEAKFIRKLKKGSGKYKGKFESLKMKEEENIA